MPSIFVKGRCFVVANEKVCVTIATFGPWTRYKTLDKSSKWKQPFCRPPRLCIIYINCYSVSWQSYKRQQFDFDNTCRVVQKAKLKPKCLVEGKHVNRLSELCYGYSIRNKQRFYILYHNQNLIADYMWLLMMRQAVSHRVQSFTQFCSFVSTVFGMGNTKELGC